jgi:Domain of Unknown Function (DUF928)
MVNKMKNIFQTSPRFYSEFNQELNQESILKLDQNSDQFDNSQIKQFAESQAPKNSRQKIMTKTSLFKHSLAIKTSLATKTLLATLIALSLPAPTFAAYVPPSDQVPSRSRGGTAGRRSPCEITKPKQTDQSSHFGLAALAPISYMGKTGSTRPTLAWYTDYCAVMPVQLSIYEYDLSNSRLNQQPIFSQRLTAKPGVSTFTLPADAIALTNGKMYAWQVVVEADSPAKSPWFRVPLLVGSPNAQLQGQLQKSTNLAQKVEAYAQAGFWYDALALTLTADQSNRLAMFGLLKQLSALEQEKEPTQQPLSRRFSYTLNRIVELEKANKLSGGTYPEGNRLSQN